MFTVRSPLLETSVGHVQTMARNKQTLWNKTWLDIYIYIHIEKNKVIKHSRHGIDLPRVKSCNR